MRTIRPATESDHDRLFELVQQSFNVPASSKERARQEFEPAAFRVVEENGAVVACVRIWDFGHVYGGRSVSGAGVASVAVAAEARGRGHGSAVMRETLLEVRAAGATISSLYPATVPIYRSLGYGFGGIRTTWKVRLESLPQDADLAVEAFDDDALDEIHGCYRAIAERANGLLDRPREWWRTRVLRSSWDDAPMYRYLVRERDRVAGYVVYRTEKSRDDWRFTIACRDLMWRTPGAARALLALASLHRSTAAAMTWIGPPAEPLADLLREDVIRHDDRFRWMLRLLDVPGAFEQRGFPATLETSLNIGVRDDLIDGNAGPWRIEVANGRAKVVETEGADAVADASTWAALWSSLLSPHDAARLGVLEATDAALAALAAMFSGPIPWSADFY